MTGTLILESGVQTTVTYEGIVNLARTYDVTDRRSNGSQAQFTLIGEYPVSIVVNVHSDADEYLTLARAGFIRRQRGQGGFR